MRNVYWFKRDLRIEDNRALYKCFIDSKEIYPIFIFDSEILKNLNSFDNRLFFLKNVVGNLQNKIKISLFYGKTEEIFESIIKILKPNAVYTAESLTWEGELRNKKIKNICEKYGVRLVEIFDNFLVNPRKIPYSKIYSHFYNKWKNLIDCQVLKLNEIELKLKTQELKIDKFKLPDFITQSKPSKGFFWSLDFLNERLKKFDFKNYSKSRNYLFEDGTSKLSPYIRFGIISIRVLYNKIKNLSTDFVKELAWREFWYHIKHYFPEIKNLEFQEKRRNLKWPNNEYFIEKFEKGETGYPIIDAAIRQLKQENWMHNRARMIVGSFLTKDLLVDWRIGEKFFSRYLIDYDEVVNVGNWQWIASVGPDPKPLRIFNPILQARRFDYKGEYILKYIPELSNENIDNLIDPINKKLNYLKIIVNHMDVLKKIKNFYNKS
jgi:deoxyribodipyrimidine photo-lyase